jgi:LPS-assembly protein
MNNLFRLTIALAAIFCLGGEARAQDAGTGKPDTAIDITADHMERDGETDVIRAWGHVVVRFEDRVLEADKVRVHRKTGIGEAKGHVILTQTDGTVLSAKRTRFNMKNKQGQIFDVAGKIEKKYYVKGREVTRIPPNRYLMTDASLTTCRGPLPDWEFEASTIDVVKDDRALFTHGIFKVRDIPVLYLPVGYIPINRNRKSGLLLPSIGYSNTDGFTFGSAYYWAINRSYDATVTVDYLGKRGVRPGLELRYAPSKNTVGEISGNYLDDNETGSEFWKVDAAHKQDLPLGFKFNGKLDLESDSSFNKTFEDDVNKRSRRSSDSFGYIHRSWTDTTVDILARYRDSSEENRDDTFAHLPDATFSSLRQPLAGGPFISTRTATTRFFISISTQTRS